MSMKGSELIVTSVLKELDSKVWECVAAKAIDKMPKHKLSK